jgi:hypothetical protein
MGRTWLGSIIMIVLWYLFIKAIVTGYYWHWFGTGSVWDIAGRIIIVTVLGMILTRAIKVFPIFKTMKGKAFLAFPLLPLHMSVAMVGVRLIGILTMRQSGWITRRFNGKGGFKKP